MIASLAFVTTYSVFGELSVIDHDHLHLMLDSSEYKDALYYLEQLKIEHPNNTEILFYQGYIYDDLGMYSEALEYYDQVLWYEPNDFETLYNKAVTLENLGDYETALVHYNKVLKLQPNDMDALQSKAMLLYHLARYDESLIQFQKVLDVEPENSNAQSYVDEIKKIKHNPGIDVIIFYAVPGLTGLALAVLFYVRQERNRKKTLPHKPTFWNVSIDKRKYQTILLVGFVIGVSGYVTWQANDGYYVEKIPHYPNSFYDLLESNESMKRQIAWDVDLVHLRFNPEPDTGNMMIVIQDGSGGELYVKKFTGFYQDHIRVESGIEHSVTLTNIGNSDVYPNGSIYGTAFDEDGNLVLNKSGINFVGFLLMALGILVCIASIPVIVVLTYKKYKKMKETYSE